MYFRKSRQVGNTKLNCPQAVKLAQVYMGIYRDSFGDTFEPGYYFEDEGVCTVNFAYRQGETVCYTDLIKVGVALDTGEIVLMEARGFVMNHCQRSIVAPTHTAEQAAARLCSNLTPKQISLALIPTRGGGEVHCFQCLCDGIDGQEVLVYLNAVTLEEEQIYILLKTDGGTLVK